MPKITKQGASFEEDAPGTPKLLPGEGVTPEARLQRGPRERPGEQGDRFAEVNVPQPRADMSGLTAPSPSANKPEWVAFAEQVNERIAESEEGIPIDDPSGATKPELVEAYGEYGNED